MAGFKVQGSWEPRFEPVVEAFRGNFAAGLDIGASFAVVHDGNLVVDIWGGELVDQPGAWQRDTLVNVYSTTKTMSFLCAHVLADRGELDFDSPVARYWPEFAANGKKDVRVSHLLAHSAGLSGMDEPVAPAELYDWDSVCDKLAAQAPWWQPGKQSGYHAITQGYLIGEVVRRITGVSIGTFFRDELAGPAGADFHIGLPDAEHHRCGFLQPPPGTALGGGMPSDSIAARTFRNPPVDALQSREAAWRRAEIPAAGGSGNARSVVTLQSAMACGGEALGTRLLSERATRKAIEVQISGKDLVLGVPMTFALGYGRSNPLAPISPSEHAMFWGGWGGSTIVIDQDERLAFSYVMNRMEAGALGDPRGARLGTAVYQSLGKLPK